jgi:hypothetical protein
MLLFVIGVGVLHVASFWTRNLLVLILGWHSRWQNTTSDGIQIRDCTCRWRCIWSCAILLGNQVVCLLLSPGHSPLDSRFDAVDYILDNFGCRNRAVCSLTEGRRWFLLRIWRLTGSKRLMFVSIESELQKWPILASFLSRLSAPLFSWVVLGILAVAASNA